MSFTTDLEDFLDNQNPGGYVQTSVNIETSDLTNRIDEIITSKGYIKSETDPTVPTWAKQPVKPTYTASEVGAMPINGISISNTLNSGTRLATITINGTSTNIYGNTSSDSGGTLTEENDPIFTSSPAYLITNTDINNWNNKSDFSGNYEDLLSPPKGFKEIIVNINNTYNQLGSRDFYLINADTINLSNDNTTPYYITDLINDYENYYLFLKVGDIAHLFLTNLDTYIDTNNNIEFYTFTLTPFINSTYITTKQIAEDNEDILDLLQIFVKYVVIIYDATNNTLYSKTSSTLQYELLEAGGSTWNMTINNLQTQIDALSSRLDELES